jgi:O-antigen/teichoic acid export membrane protein
LGQLLGFAALAYTARQVGPANLGAYSFALVLATYFGLLSSFGLSNLAIRDIASNRSSLRSTIRGTLLLQGALSIAAYLLLLVLAPLLVPDGEAREMVPIVALTLISTAFTLDWVLLSLGRFRSVALWRLAGQVVYASLVPLLVVSGRVGAFRYAWLNILGLAVTAVGIAFAARHSIGTRSDSGRMSWRSRLRRSIPFGYSLIMIQIYAAIDSLMLGYLDSTHAVGIYAVANKLPAGLVLLANVWINAFLPHTARRLATAPEALAEDLGHVLTATLSLSIAICVGAYLCAGPLMPLLFGHAFRAAAAPFWLLAVAGSLVLVQASFSNILRGQRYYTVVITGAAGAIVALNFVLIPLSGPLGAAIATVAGELGLTSLTFLGVRKMLGTVRVDSARLLRSVVAVGIMAAAMILVPALGGGVIAQICVGLVIYMTAAAALRVFDTRLLRAA